MALSEGERARLGRIEAELSRTDPRLAARLGRGPSAPGSPAPSGWSTAHTWMLVVFVVAFCSWTLAAWIGWFVAVIFVAWGILQRRDARKHARQNAGDTGWWYRPIDRW